MKTAEDCMEWVDEEFMMGNMSEEYYRGFVHHLSRNKETIKTIQKIKEEETNYHVQDICNKIIEEIGR